MTNPYKDPENPYRSTPSLTDVPPGTPVKAQVEVQKDGSTAVVNVKVGEVNFVDKLKGYYHTIITVIGGILVFLNEVTPITDGLGADAQRYISVAIVGATAILNMLKSNEQWVNKL